MTNLPSSSPFRRNYIAVLEKIVTDSPWCVISLSLSLSLSSVSLSLSLAAVER